MSTTRSITRHPLADCLIGLPDWADFTGGVTFEFNRRATPGHRLFPHYQPEALPLGSHVAP